MAVSKRTRIIIGVVAVLAIGGVVPFVAAGSAASDGKAQCQKVPRCDQGTIDAVHQLDAAALGLWIGAGLGAGAAVALWAIDRPRAKAKPPVRALLGPGAIRVEATF